MAESTITAKDQTTMSADISARVHAKSGTRLVWSAMPDDAIIVRAKTKSIPRNLPLTSAASGAASQKTRRPRGSEPDENSPFGLFFAC